MYLGLIGCGARLKIPACRRARRDPDPGGRDQPADHQVLGGLVEYAASAGVGDADRRTFARSRLSDSAIVMALAFSLLFLTLHLRPMRNEILRRRCAPCR